MSDYELAEYGYDVCLAAELSGVTPGTFMSRVLYDTRPEAAKEAAHISFLLALGENPFNYGYSIDTTREGSVERFYQSPNWVR